MAAEQDLVFFITLKRSMETLFSLEHHLTPAASAQLARDFLQLRDWITRARGRATFEGIKTHFDDQMRKSAHGEPL